MSELRLNVLTNEWVILAPVRSARPSDLRRELPPAPRVPHDPACPFCVGNEDHSVETARVPDGAGGWRTRVVLNKFPALSRDAPAGPEPSDAASGLRVRSDAYGAHEVFIDSPHHDRVPALAPLDHLVTLLGCYRARYRVMAADPRVAHVVIFKNHGEGAGASLAHPHSQLIASPVASRQVLDRVVLFERHLQDHGGCLACAVLADELADGERILLTTPHFVALTPWAALSPFHIWILPRRHTAHFGDIADDELADFAGALRQVLRTLHYGLGDPDYNYVIRSGPACGAGDYHWYLSIVPRIAKHAGFEFGSGMYINPTWPEETARFLRAVEVPADGTG